MITKAQLDDTIRKAAAEAVRAGIRQGRQKTRLVTDEDVVVQASTYAVTLIGGQIEELMLDLIVEGEE